MRKPRCHTILASEDDDGGTILTACDRLEHEDGWHRSTLTTFRGVVVDIRWMEPEPEEDVISDYRKDDA